jgi:hypothetical protein
MDEKTRTVINNQIYKLGMIDGYLDMARDCFSHFQHFQPTQTELDQYSTHGHEVVQKMRAEINKVAEVLKILLESN